MKERITAFNLKKWFNKNLTVLILLTLLVFIAYFNSLFNDFVSDDKPSILENQNLNKFSYIWQARPAVLRQAIYFITVNLFGRLPLFFHLINIFFHLGTVLILYLLVDVTLGFKIALFSSLIFAIHPLQTEAVTWISGGPYSQYAFFLLLSLLAFVLSLKNKKYYYLSLASFIFSLMSSEKAMVFPFILLTLMIAFRPLRNWKKIIVPFAIGVVWILLYVSKVPERINVLQTEHYQENHFLNPAVQIPIAITDYFKLIFFPKDLALYHSEMYFTDKEYILRLIIFIGFLGLIVHGYLRNRQLFFWLSFFFISLSPTLTPFGVSWIVAERYVYLGAIGIYILMSLAIAKLTESARFKNVVYVFFSLLILSLMIRTLIRNNDWKNEDNLWVSMIKTSPSSAQNHLNLGDMYGRHGNLQKAAEEFRRAIELKPNYADAYHNLANVYLQMGKIDEGIENYKEAIKFNPSLWQSHQNLADIYLLQKNYPLALEALQAAVKINPQDSILHLNLGVLYMMLNEKDKAKTELNFSLQLDPQNKKAKKALIDLTLSH